MATAQRTDIVHDFALQHGLRSHVSFTGVPGGRMKGGGGAGEGGGGARSSSGTPRFRGTVGKGGGGIGGGAGAGGSGDGGGNLPFSGTGAAPARTVATSLLRGLAGLVNQPALIL